MGVEVSSLLPAHLSRVVGAEVRKASPWGGAEGLKPAPSSGEAVAEPRRRGGLPGCSPGGAGLVAAGHGQPRGLLVSGTPRALCGAQLLWARSRPPSGRQRPLVPPCVSSQAGGRWSWSRGRVLRALRAHRRCLDGPQKDRGTNRPTDTAVGKSFHKNVSLCPQRLFSLGACRSAKLSPGRTGQRPPQTSRVSPEVGDRPRGPQEPSDLLQLNAGSTGAQ